MKALIASILLSLVAFLAAAEPVWASGKPTPVKSYRQWKNEKIQQVQTRIGSAKSRLERKKSDPSLERQLRSEQMALENARELTVSDYFAGYLTRLRDRKTAYKEVAGKLTPEEVAELMSAYANSVFGTQAGTLPASAQKLDPRNEIIPPKIQGSTLTPF